MVTTAVIVANADETSAITINYDEGGPISNISGCSRVVCVATRATNKTIMITIKTHTAAAAPAASFLWVQLHKIPHVIH